MTTKPKGTVLVVDDEHYVRESLVAILERRNFTVRSAASVAEALVPERLAGLDVVLCDLKLPGDDGSVLVKELAEREPLLPVVMLTGHGTVASAVECIKAGAYDYLLKPADPEELTLTLERALGQSTMKRELAYLRDGEAATTGRREPLGVSAGWREVVATAELAAPADTSVLILGESGTGKEEVAKLVHRHSERSRRAFVKVNCAAIPVELFESEFFGHKKGAFTGAVSDREGRFRVAHGGTLFLDEIDSLPLTAQAKVLRVIEDGTFERLGDSQPTSVDVRLICASNVDLKVAVEEGGFRTDLYYRINVMTMQVPPLRRRREDVPVLAEAFLEEMGRRLNRPLAGIDKDAMAALTAYDWPGNVRELRNIIERGVLLERGERLSVACLPPPLSDGAAGRMASGKMAAGKMAADDAGQGAAADAGAEPGSSAEEETLNLRQRVLAAERRVLIEALERSDGVRREAAKLLGIDERNMAYYLKKHDLMEVGR